MCNSVKDELADAIFIADVRRVELLLNLDPEILSARPPVLVNRVNELYGRTPIMGCGLDPQHHQSKVDADCRQIVEMVHKAGANLSHVDKNGWTALSMAAMNGYTQMCSYLVDQNVSIDSQDDHGLTPLMKAGAHAQLETFKLLFAKGANISILDNTGLTVLHHMVNSAMSNSSFLPALKTAVETVSVAVVDATSDKDGRNILMYTVINNHAATTKLLLDAGCNPTLSDSFGVSLSAMSRDLAVRQMIAEATALWSVKQHKEWLKKTSKKKEKDL